MKKRGPKPRGYVDLTTAITPEQDAALTEVVLATGVAKAHLVREALHEYLLVRGQLTTDSFVPAATSGQGRFARLTDMKELSNAHA